MHGTFMGAGRWLAGALLTLLLAWAPPVAAQGDVALSALTIELWPEYDRASMLVILRGTLAPEVTLPASITISIPAVSGGPFAVAAQQADGSLMNAQFVTSADGDLIAVTLQATVASFQVEYYDPGLAITGDQRAFTFDWAPSWRVVAATLRVQEPRDAAGLSSQPPVMLAGSSDLGLNYHTASLGALAPGQAVQVELGYTKSTSTLSVEEIPAGAGLPTVADAAPVNASVSTFGLPTGPDDWRIWVGGALLLGGLGLAGWGGALWWRRRSAGGDAVVPAPLPRRRVRPIARAPRVESTSESAPQTGLSRPAVQYCTSCGRPLAAKDAFCRQCGAPARARPEA